MPKMPSIESFGGRPEPRTVGPVSAPDMGIASRGLQDLGGSLEQVGDILETVQQRNDKYRAEDSFNKLKQKDIELTSKYSEFKAADVAGDDKFYERYMSERDKATQEFSKELKNPRQQRLFKSRSEVGRLSYGNSLINHITRETDVYHDKVYKDTVELAVEVAAKNYISERTVETEILRVRKITEENNARNGEPKQSGDKNIAENVSAVYEAVIKSAIDSQDYATAKERFKKHEKHMTFDDVEAIKPLLKASGLLDEAQKNVDGYKAKKLSELEANEQVKKIKDAEVRAATKKELDRSYGEDAKIIANDQAAAGEQAWAIFANTKQLPPLSLMDRMDGKERIALEATAEKAAQGKTIKTDFATWYGLQQMMEENPDQFKRENLNKYSHLISTADLKTLAKAQTEDNELIIATTKNQIRTQGAADAGLDPKNGTKPGKTGDNVRAFWRRFDDEITAFPALNNGKIPNEIDMRNIMDRLVINVKRPIYRPDRPAGRLEIKGVPTEIIDEYANAIQAAGKEVTEENILILHQHEMNK